MRGGEKVLEAILELFPTAELFTLFHFEGSVSSQIESHNVRTSFLQHLANAGNYRRLLPLYPAAIRQFDLSSFDLVVSSSHAVAAGVRHGSVPHVVYCHTPMRYIWDRFDDYFPSSRPALRAVASLVAPSLRRWDAARAADAGTFVANSNFVAERIRRYYGREAGVIHPFVDGSFLEAPLESDRDDYHVVVSALVPYKRIDEAMAASVIAKRRLIVVGSGPLLESYRKEAPPSVELPGWVDETRLRQIVGRARSLIMPGIEDFGITALEANALGTPVITTAEGGAREAIGPNGGIVYSGGAEKLAQAMVSVESGGWDRQLLRAHASSFSRQTFRERFAKVIESELQRQGAGAKHRNVT